jgi:putative AlgH/UPF0301 family transcriptional regulator
LQIRPGSLLIAHPVHATLARSKQVVYITESNNYSTTGLTLNNLGSYDLRELLARQNIDWYGDNRLYHGGDYNGSAMVMLHSDEWYSSNTMPVDNHLSISSDDVMMEKLEMGNRPDWYRLFVGIEAWDQAELEHQVKRTNPKWIVLAKPSQALIELSDESLWHNALAEYSQDVFDSYF